MPKDRVKRMMKKKVRRPASKQTKSGSAGLVSDWYDNPANPSGKNWINFWDLGKKKETKKKVKRRAKKK